MSQLFVKEGNTLEKQGAIRQIAKIFPDYFDRFELPEGARSEAIKVYRACRVGNAIKHLFCHPMNKIILC